MNASPNEVALILNAIDDVRKDLESVRQDVAAGRTETRQMDTRINGRIRRLERFRWQMMGAFALATVLLSVALRFV